jgi:hypothetical protein
MAVARALTAITAFVGWLYSWALIRAIRSDFAVGDLGGLPLWLIVLMGVSSSALIAASLAAAMRAGLWPLLAATAGLTLFLLVVLGQLALMKGVPSVQDPSFGDALRAAVRVRTRLAAGFWVVGVPTGLVLLGLAGFALKSQEGDHEDVGR